MRRIRNRDFAVYCLNRVSIFICPTGEDHGFSAVVNNMLSGDADAGRAVHQLRTFCIGYRVRTGSRILLVMENDINIA